jgi:Na+-translocating ferredoxin:NAD+ oxidoreductase RnfD subunit
MTAEAASLPRRIVTALPADPRKPQIAILASLLAFGALYRGFLPTPWAVPAALAGAWGMESWVQRAGWTPRHLSGTISALSAVLLFRSEHAWVYGVVAAVAVASKHLFRIDGRHFVNPTNGAVLLGSVVLPGWIGSGQWGHDLVGVFVLAGAASLTLVRAARIDTALAVVLATAAFLASRIAFYGYPWATFGHFFTDGAFWLFALYMVTDPKTTPRWAAGRWLHGVVVAAVAVALLQFWYVRDSFLWALLACAPLVPALDRWRPAAKELHR